MIATPGSGNHGNAASNIPAAAAAHTLLYTSSFLSVPVLFRLPTLNYVTCVVVAGMCSAFDLNAGIRM